MRKYNATKGLQTNKEKVFVTFADEVRGPSTDLMSECAKDGVNIVGWSLIVKDPLGML